MIFYFSGTGNSQLIAERIAEETQDTTTDIARAPSSTLPEGEVLGLVFPVYAWGLPRIVREFISRLEFSAAPPYIYMVCTCGDDVGKTDQLLERLLKRKGAHLNAAWSVRMPNTYVALPGFDVDPQQVAQEKVVQSLAQCKAIGQQILQRPDKVRKAFAGSFPYLKSYLLRPLFHLLLTGDRHFSSSEQCVQCGLCIRKCPVQNIQWNAAGQLQWKGHCTDCLACYHHCPKHAIAFGRFTRKKGQYTLGRLLKGFK